METIICGYLQGNRQTPGFLRWCKAILPSDRFGCDLFMGYRPFGGRHFGRDFRLFGRDIALWALAWVLFRIIEADKRPKKLSKHLMPWNFGGSNLESAIQAPKKGHHCVNKVFTILSTFSFKDRSCGSQFCQHSHCSQTPLI